MENTESNLKYGGNPEYLYIMSLYYGVQTIKIVGYGQFP